MLPEYFFLTHLRQSNDVFFGSLKYWCMINFHSIFVGLHVILYIWSFRMENYCLLNYCRSMMTDRHSSGDWILLISCHFNRILQLKRGWSGGGFGKDSHRICEEEGWRGRTQQVDYEWKTMFFELHHRKLDCDWKTMVLCFISFMNYATTILLLGLHVLLSMRLLPLVINLWVIWIGTIAVLQSWSYTITIRLFRTIPLQFQPYHYNSILSEIYHYIPFRYVSQIFWTKLPPYSSLISFIQARRRDASMPASDGSATKSRALPLRSLILLYGTLEEALIWQQR
jgi:hypothetical protein